MDQTRVQLVLPPGLSLVSSRTLIIKHVVEDECFPDDFSLNVFLFVTVTTTSDDWMMSSVCVKTQCLYTTLSLDKRLF